MGHDDTGANWLDTVRWNAQGLIPVVAQEVGSGAVLMLAWMNRDALEQTLDGGEAVYWSRSRRRLWRKGERSGHVQVVRAVQLDCDGDTLLLTVEQRGGIACHTGRHSCFYRTLRNGVWAETEPVLMDPELIYQDGA